MTSRVQVAVLVLFLLGGSSAVETQGHRGAPPGLLKKDPPSSGGVSSGPASGAQAESSVANSSLTVRSFGTWLDDATVASPGSVWLTLAATGWSAPAWRGRDAPSVGIAAGLQSRSQLSVSIPISHVSSTDDGSSSTTLGDVYAGVKLVAVERTRHPIGVSVTPTLEILSRNSGGRAGFVLPVNIEAGSGRTRVYGSTGYFSRGAIFVSAALERHLSRRVAATGVLLQSWSTAGPLATEAFGLRHARTDASGSLAVFLSSSVAAFGSVGRTISPLEYDGARHVLSVGLAVMFTPPGEMPVRPPR